MKKNMGKADKILRILIGLLFLVLYITGTIGGVLGIILLILSVMFIVTGFISYCPLYHPLGINTIKKENS